MTPNFGRDLGNESTQTADERRAEADRILKIIDVFADPDCFTMMESNFIGSLADPSGVDSPISPKQLRWLRDIKAKYCE